MYTKNCAICEKEFHSLAHNARYCSLDCISESNRRRWAKNNPSKKYSKICDICGGLFDTKWVFQKYCSDKCKKNANANNKRIRRQLAKAKIDLNNDEFLGLCSICGDEVYVTECLDCGFFSCSNCKNEIGVCHVCSGIHVIESLVVL
jgi:hypothetical protein